MCLTNLQEINGLDVNTDDGSCVFLGCTNPIACNYDPNANIDNGTCYEPSGCNDPSFLEYDESADCPDNENACLTLIVTGCTSPVAFNYDPNANEDDGSCIAVALGCTDETAFNYDSDANTDDESCIAVALSVLTKQHSIMTQMPIQMTNHVLL